MKRLFKNLTFWVLIAITAGILIGHLAPEIALKQILSHPWKRNFLGQEFEVGSTLSEFLSKTFISVVKQLINPIIFLTITLGIASMGSLKKVGRVGVKALLYFEIVTTFALVTGVIVALIIQPGRGIITSSVSGDDIRKYTQGPGFDWLIFLKSNSTLMVLIVALITGIFLNYYMHKKKIILIFQTIANYVFKILHGVMLFAPLGAFGGMAYTISKYGIKTLLPLVKLMSAVYITMGIFIFFVLWLILKHYKVSIFKYLKYIQEELLVVLGTSSSEAALPSLMEKLERIGCSKSVVGLVIPAGYSFNLDGTTIYLSMSIIFLAQVFHVQLSIMQLLTIVVVLMITSKGAAGVAGSGFVVLASTLTAIKVIPVEGLALLLGVDRFLSEARAITNFIGNGVATIWIANNEKEFDRNKMIAVLEQKEATGVIVPMNPVNENPEHN
ncbi:MAG TPA: cation:dicarboxylase symporter family transporter [Chitinophagaceae bacterium]|nr:cation:dicarboxylase symporter family transporter [Chitinophagaceae bacterium]